ncbi:MAG: DNA gyrase subunit A [Clostridia bacterium]|nr:DNA gyrase subunit A [Clostridia bacterium]MBQ5955993.1 DNA gyrase subunit A [Clostridia bacterium]MBR6822060.1 DNA gyrase subunit A [Clostridia bacterium]
MSKELDQNEINNKTRIIPLELGGEMKKSFISYAMAVIINRALPDVRDGLKPVHRRIIYSMAEQGITPDKPHKKSARIVGDVLGKYHPHGDTAIYESMVRMAQDFSTRYLLVDGHGNFGSVDGDGAAAMRYTEARLGKISMELVRDMDKDTVDFYPNFDGSLQQPVTLPSRFPNLLVNGSGGIAVGMATNIPPHNLREVIDASIAYIDDPDISIDGIMEYIKGPDFPTGGQIIGFSGIKKAYETGRGIITVRAKYEIEDEKDHQNIVVTEIPYQVNKELLVHTIRELSKDKKIDGIVSANDESDSNGMRVVIELKKGTNPNVVLNLLFKHTQLQTSFGIIMLALVDTEPKILTIKDTISEYVKYQKEIIERRTRFDLEKAEKRAHIVEGLLKALDVIDEVIATIRASRDGNDARNALMKNFDLSEVQAQAILDMRLQRLTGLERDRLTDEYNNLMSQIAYFKDVLSNEALVYGIIKDDLTEIKNKYGDDRRTSIEYSEDDTDIESMIQEENIVITMTQHGYIKRTLSSHYKVQRRGGKGITGLLTKDEDEVKNILTCSTHDSLLFFTNKGRVYVKKAYQIPAFERYTKGIPVVNIVPLEDEEKISVIMPVRGYEDHDNLIMVTREGIIKKSRPSDFTKIRQTGIRAITLREDDELIDVLKSTNGDRLLIGTSNGQSIKFDLDTVSTLGRTAMGVIGIKLREGDFVVGALVISDNVHVLTLTENGFGKLSDSDTYTEQGRAGYGVRAMRLSEKTGKMIGILAVDQDKDIMIINNNNLMERFSVTDISVTGRNTQGVKVMRLKDDEKIISAAVVDRDEEEFSEEEENED